jgi:hypothetical protein
MTFYTAFIPAVPLRTSRTDVGYSPNRITLSLVSFADASNEMEQDATDELSGNEDL